MHNLQSLVNGLFRGDARRVMKQNIQSYVILHEGQINDEDWAQHLEGRVSAAIYLLDENVECSTMCFDIDIPKLQIPDNQSEREKLKKERLIPIIEKIMAYLKENYGLTESNILIEDTGGRGYHMWLFFENAQNGLSVVTFLNEVKNGCNLPELEVFPEGGTFGPTGFSKSLVKLPLGVHRKYNNSRSVFVNSTSFENISFDCVESLLSSIQYIDSSIIEVAEDRYSKFLSANTTSYSQGSAVSHTDIVSFDNLDPTYIGAVGEMTFFCPALNGLVNKAKKEQNLSHNERFALAAILKKYRDGEEKLHQILSHCINYDKEKSEYQIKSVVPSLLSCKTLQSPKYQICKGWCNSQFSRDDANGKKPNPGWFSRLEVPNASLKIDTSPLSTLEQVASLSNLHHAWKQANRQAVEREVFEDRLAYDLFEKDLWNNLEMLRAQLLATKWIHNNFTLIEIPKRIDSDEYRPFVSISPREAIVQLAILNVIGPRIDSMFNRNSLGNRLAISPKEDNQIFQDWRRQNRYREFKKKGFTTYDETNHYVITDLKKFYEFIRHDKLLAMLRMYIDDQQVLTLIQNYVEAPWEGVEREYGGEHRNMGIPQGPALSAFLANLYLIEIDQWLELNTVDFVRYVDDIVMVFDDIDVAIQRMKAFESVLANHGLEITPEKTTVPTPVSENDKLVNWLDDIRYDFVKTSSTQVPLSEDEKQELFQTLKRLAGEGSKDVKTITRSLGLFIRFTERIGDKNLLKTVYATAAHLLVEDRPKHNATCIAVQSLVKACADQDLEAYEEISAVYKNRKDEYLKILLCQETAKIIEDHPSAGENSGVDSRIISMIQRISMDPTAPIAAAAALNFLIKHSADQAQNISDYQTIAFSENDFLRPRVIYFLDKIGKMNKTSLARVIPSRLLEFEIFCHLILENGTEVFKTLLKQIENNTFQLALPVLISKGIIFSEVDIARLWHLVPDNSKSNIAYYIANRIVSELPMEIDRSTNIDAIIKFTIEYGISDIGTEIYRFAKYANVLIDQGDTLEHTRYEGVNTAQIDKLPTPEGIILQNPVFQEHYFVQDAMDNQGNNFYYEYIDIRELNKVGISLLQYKDAATTLVNAQKISPAIIYDSLASGALICLTTKKDSLISLHKFLKQAGLSKKEDVHKLLEKIVYLIDNSIQLLQKSELKALVPIPCLHTIFIDDKEELWFGNISLAIGGEKRYIGRSGSSYKLQQEDPIMESLGLLFFEIENEFCAIEELVRNKKVDKDTLIRFEQSNGILFSEIVKKATRPVISERYASSKFFLNDVKDWSVLEMALQDKTKITQADADLLRAIWNLDIFISRRVIAEYKGNISMLLYSHNISKNIIAYLVRFDIHRQPWLWDNWSLIADNELYRKHIAASQAIIFADQLLKKTEDLHETLDLKREIEFPYWLYASASHIELESLRRGLHKVILHDHNKEEFRIALNLIQVATGNNLKISLFLNQREERLSEAIMVLQTNIVDVANRMDFWFKNSFPLPPSWIHDNLLIMFITISKMYGLQIVNEDGEVAHVHSSKKLFNRVDDLLFIQKLLSVIKSDIVNNGKDKPIPHMKYVVRVQGRLRDSNIQLLRDVHRYFDSLTESIYMKFKLKEVIKLKVTSIKRLIDLSKEHIIDENHNHTDQSLSSSCIFSIDIYENKRTVRQPLTASFPIVTGKRQNEILHPVFHNEKFNSINRIRLRYQRRHPVRSAFFDLHTLAILGTPLLYFLAVSLSKLTDVYSKVILDGGVMGSILFPSTVYFVSSYKRMMRQNPVYKKRFDNLFGINDD